MAGRRGLTDKESKDVRGRPQIPGFSLRILVAERIVSKSNSWSRDFFSQLLKQFMP